MNPEGSVLPIAAIIFLSWFVFPFLTWFFFRKSLNENREIPPPTSVNNTTSSASASSSFSAADLASKYEVFLSFRGTDTRRGFTDFLYTNLVEAGIRTFKDDNELQIGEEIGPDLLKAIKDSKISIPIFSKNYASSKWCLRELAQIVECHRTEGQMIFPIFYDVEPSDVRNQKGSYKKAFRQHEKNFDEKEVQGWKDATTIVGELKGFELSKVINGYEGKLVKMVVEKVVLGLKKNYANVPDNLVGMDHHVEEMERLLDVDSDDVRIIGIHGMGGIGKTTISKAIYNQLCDLFKYCCFLDDVRERSQHHNGIVVLQKELVSKFSKQQSDGIHKADEGITTIKNVVHRKRVLLVLDDIDRISQFDKLVGKSDWFGVGSRILITTRNKDVLDTLGVTCRKEGLLEVYNCYEPQLMNRDHSLQLFSKYAFKQDFPPEDYNILSKDVVSTAAGLPLVLVTIGSLLFGKEDKTLWEETVRKLQRIPHKEVLDKLRISFEALDYEQQQIFLDIACLFIGKDKANPYYMWDDCEFYPGNGINSLVLRSLIKVGDDNRLRMHDQLRDLGRQIVREGNLNKPEEQSRVWHAEEAMDVLKGGLGTKKIEALNLDLRAVKDDKYEQLQLAGEVYERLKIEGEELYIHHLAGQDFSQLPNLRFLRLGSAFLDGDFKHLFPNLRWLKWRCYGKFIPINLNLKNLVILDLSGSTITDEWEGWTLFKAAKKLKVLNLRNCKCLGRGPNFSLFTTLKILNISGKGLREINPSLGNLVALRALDLSHCNLAKLDCSTFKDLESLNLSCCGSLLEVSGLEWSKSLTNLEATYSASLRTLGDFSNLKRLKELRISDCLSLTKIQGLEKLEALELLDMRRCTSIVRLPDLSNLRMLKKLHLNECWKLGEIEGLGGLESLELLDMSKCKSIERLPDLSNSRMLKNLFLDDCVKLREIEGLRGLESLELLKLEWCKSIVRLPDLSNSRMLKELILNCCVKLRETEGLGGLESLELLKMEWCQSIVRLPDLSNSRMLKELVLYKCDKLLEVCGLGGLESLEYLDMRCCYSIERLPNLSNLGKLKKLYLCNCKKLHEIEGLSGWVSLERLDLSYCESLGKTLDFSYLKNLKDLRVDGLKHWTQISGLEELKSLEVLGISDCSPLEKLPDLSKLESLKRLYVSDCKKQPEIQGLEELRKRNCWIQLDGLS